MQMQFLRSFDNYFSANLLLQRMQNEGIHAYLKDENTVTIDPILSNAIGGIKLMVSEKDFSKAQTILQELDDAYRKSVACPKCQAYEIEETIVQNAGNFLTAILTWITGSYAIAPHRVYRCNRCGHEMKNLPDSPELNN